MKKKYHKKKGMLRESNMQYTKLDNEGKAYVD